MIPASLYYPIFLYTVIVLTIYQCSTISTAPYNRIAKGSKNFTSAFILTTVFAIWLGMRPMSIHFGDTYSYAHIYHTMGTSTYLPPNNSGEWVWNKFMFLCAQIMTVSDFFTLVSIGYFCFTLYACKKLTPNNIMIAVLFNLGAFSFYSYGVNGIRNGLACAMLLSALALYSEKQRILALCIAFVAFNIHHSTMLPIGMMLISAYLIKSFKQAYIFWILSIVISLIAGSSITSIFASLGFDDRLAYLESTEYSYQFRYTGFRWDFLLYSMMPIILGYYIIFKRGIRNKTYELLLNTYTLSNAFWVMVIRAEFSNRFAYLSWFMYPLVLAYPLLKLDVWGNLQGKRLQQIMLAHVGFTWFMSYIY